MMELYENIRKYRIEKKMSQAELAEKIGYTDRSTIAKIERGDIDLSRSKIMAFAKALGVPAGELMGNTGIVNQYSLREDEAQLLGIYNLLTDAARKEVMDYLEYLRSKEENLRKKGSSYGSVS